MKQSTPKNAQIKNKSRAKYRCPTDLEEYIEFAYFVPPDVKLPPIEEIRASICGNVEAKSMPTRKQQSRISGETFERCFHYFPNDVRKKILDSYPGTRSGGWLPADPIDWATDEWYPRFVVFLKALRQIAKFYGHLRKCRDRRVRLELFLRGQLLPERPKILVDIISAGSPVLALGVDDPFLRSLLGVDGDRIRQCEICERIYWAKRREARYCSQKCGNLLRQREYRSQSEAERAERLRVRRENDSYKKRERKKG